MKLLSIILSCCLLVLMTSCGNKKIVTKVAKTQNAKDAVAVFVLRDKSYVDSPLYTGMVVNIGAVSVPHIPVDAASLGGSDYYTNSISPNGKYIVLPLGRYHGFGIYYIDYDLLRKIRSASYDDLVRVVFHDADTSKDGALSHSFLGWEGNSEFSFIVGMSRTKDTLQYDVLSKQLYTKNSIYVLESKKSSVNEKGE